MRVLVITNTIKSGSGWGVYSRSVLLEYPNLGIEYSVLTEITDKNLDGIDPHEKRKLLPLHSLKAFFKNVFLVRRLLKEYDVVHAFDGWPYAVYALFATFGTRKKLFVNAVGTYSVAPLDDFFKGLLLRWAYKKAKRIFAISDFIKNRVLDRVTLPNIETVYLGATPLRRLSEEERNVFKEKYGMKEQSPIVLTVGAIKDRKGQYDTLEAISILKEKYPHILYCVVGSDKEKAYVDRMRNFVSKNNLGENVKIISDAKGDDALSFFYSIADIFSLNSKQDGRHFEGFGLVMLEVAQFGVPVVGSRGAGIPEAMQDGYNGYLANESDPKSIAEAILKTLSQKEKMSKNSLEFFKRFSWKKTATGYIRYYSL